MITTQYRNQENGIYNETGLQVKGTNAVNLDGLNPKELIEASIGLCVSITFTKLLQRDNLYRDDLDFTVTVAAVKHETANRFERFDVKMSFPDYLDDAYIEKITPQIELGCTIGNTIRKSAETTFERIYTN